MDNKKICKEWMIKTKLLMDKKITDSYVRYERLNWVERMSIPKHNYFIDLHFQVARELNLINMMSSYNAYFFTIYCIYMNSEEILALDYILGDEMPTALKNGMFVHIMEKYNYPNSIIAGSDSESNENSEELCDM
jgi:hypothetical protein